MQAIGFLIYMGVGIIQLAAVMAGLESWWGVNAFLSFIVALIVAYIPLLGQIVGMVGAMDAWGWAWWQAAGLFFGSLVIAIALGGMMSIVEWFQYRRYR